MTVFLWTALTGLGLFLLVPSLVFLAEVAAGSLLPARETETSGVLREARVAVLIPAHNEAAGIEPTIYDIQAQLVPSDRILVVADNCTDETASVAAGCGADVSIRNDPEKIGKGYALDWGIKHLSAAPPDILIVVDADCRLASCAIQKLSRTCFETGRPIQALYLMSAATSSINQQVAQFAWCVKNLVRPLGLWRVNLPCQLMGTGMAFPWKLVQSANLSNGSIVEDMKLGLELGARGHAPLFCPSAIVTSTFPTSDPGSQAQRKRWEQGHFSLIWSAAPKLLYQAIGRRDLMLGAMALDVLVPPLSLLILLVGAATAVTALAAFCGHFAVPFVLNVACLASVASAVFLAWAKHGMSVIPASDLLLIVPYFWKKVRLYTALAAGGRVSHWTRADRG